MDTQQTITTVEKRGLSGSTLKIIAIVTMLIDHLGAGLLGRLLYQSGYVDIAYAQDVQAMMEWMREHMGLYWAYTLSRAIGRVAFPIFCFLLVEGFQKTRDVKKYAIRLGMFALISEIPFDLAFSSKIVEFSYQNVYFTLFFGLLTMIACDVISKQNWKKGLKGLLTAVAIVAGSVIAELLMTDYGAIGVICIIVLYLFRINKVYQIIAGCVAFIWELTAPLAFIPIGFYSGKRGLKLKYVFYAFYPVHLLIIYGICILMGLQGYAAV